MYYMSTELLLYFYGFWSKGSFIWLKAAGAGQVLSMGRISPGLAIVVAILGYIFILILT